VSDQRTGNRRIDRIRDDAYVRDLGELPLDDLRARRDDCLAEREYLSLLRRLVQGRAEILRAELDARDSGEDLGPLVDRLAQILAGDEPAGGSRGEAVRVGVPEEEMLLARRRIERPVADAGIPDPTSSDDGRVAGRHHPGMGLRRPRSCPTGRTSARSQATDKGEERGGPPPRGAPPGGPPPRGGGGARGGRGPQPFLKGGWGGGPKEGMLLGRRRIERLVADAGISDPTSLDDERLAAAVDLLATEEGEVSGARTDVIRVLDTLQDELKRRYREDPTLVLS